MVLLVRKRSEPQSNSVLNKKAGYPRQLLVGTFPYKIPMQVSRRWLTFASSPTMPVENGPLSVIPKSLLYNFKGIHLVSQKAALRSWFYTYPMVKHPYTSPNHGSLSNPYQTTNLPQPLAAVDPPAKSLAFLGFSGKPLDFPKKEV